MRNTKRMLGLGLAAALAVAACDEGGPTGPGGTMADFAITMESASQGGAAGVAGYDGPAPAAIAAESVESITLEIGDVEALSEEGDWVFAGTVDASVDLMNLPEEGFALVDGSLPEGEYHELRLYLTGDPTITLAEEIRIGGAVYAAGEHTLDIPSGDQNGVRLPAEFEVEGDGQALTILVDGRASVRKVVVTGSGSLKISPVLKVHDEDGDEVGEYDDDPDDEDDEGEEDEIEGTVAGVDVEGGTFVAATTDGEVTVVVEEDTEIDGDLLTLDAVFAALEGEPEVYVEAEGELQEDGSLVAAEVEFETEGEADDDQEEEVEGPVSSVDVEAGTLVVAEGDAEIIVVVDGTTDFEKLYETLAEVAAALEAGTVVHVEAEGVMQEDGTLLASELEFETEVAAATL